MKIFEIEQDYVSVVYKAATLKVFGLPVVTFESTRGYSREVTISLGLVEVNLHICKPTCCDLVDGSVGGGLRFRGPKGFKVFPVPYLTATLDSFFGYVTVNIL